MHWLEKCIHGLHRWIEAVSQAIASVDNNLVNILEAIIFHKLLMTFIIIKPSCPIKKNVTNEL